MTHSLCWLGAWSLAALTPLLLAARAPAPGGATAPAVPAVPATPPAPRIAGLVVRVVDLDQAVEFYRGVAGFETVRVDWAAGSADLVNGDVSLRLLKVRDAAHHVLPGPSEAHLNLQVPSLDAALADAARRGVRQLADKPLGSAIGPNMPIADPAGNLLYLIEASGGAGQQERPARPRVFNYGITVPAMPAMAEARRFYEGLLGFKVYSEAYYPPVIPYLPAGVLQVVLHESATQAAAPPAPDSAQMNLVLEVDDLDAACRDLGARGATVRAARDAAVPGRHAELVDPFGNVHLLVEHAAAPARQAAP
jgi:catechol 2,3-dioxygenase-like lactoylglutathione lyase family enzyme